MTRATITPEQLWRAQLPDEGGLPWHFVRGTESHYLCGKRRASQFQGLGAQGGNLNAPRCQTCSDVATNLRFEKIVEAAA